MNAPVFSTPAKHFADYARRLAKELEGFDWTPVEQLAYELRDCWLTGRQVFFAGNGGSGHFSGNIIDVSVAIYAPINIAIAGPHSTADADQINNVLFDQSAVQIAGIGGHGGHGNLALGGDVAMHLLSDLHLIG